METKEAFFHEFLESFAGAGHLPRRRGAGPCLQWRLRGSGSESSRNQNRPDRDSGAKPDSGSDDSGSPGAGRGGSALGPPQPRDESDGAGHLQGPVPDEQG